MIVIWGTEVTFLSLLIQMSQGGKHENSPDREKDQNSAECSVLSFPFLAGILSALSFGKGSSQCLAVPCSGAGSMSEAHPSYKRSQGQFRVPRAHLVHAWGGKRLPKALITSCAPPAPLLQTRNCPRPREDLGANGIRRERIHLLATWPLPFFWKLYLIF